MNRRSLAARVWRFLGGCLGTLFIACVFGTGTDTENGVAEVSVQVVDGNGAPVQGLEMRVHVSSYRPDFIGGQPALINPGVRTDAEGYARLIFRDTGVFVAEGRVLDDVSLLLDTIRVTAGTGGGIRLTARVPTFARGKVQMLSGYRIDTGMVFLRGTDRLVPVRRDGSYDFGLLPSNFTGMSLGVRYAAKPKDTNFVLVSSDSARPGQVLLLAGAEGACRDSLPDSVTVSASGGGATPTDSILADAAHQACAGRTGNLVQISLVLADNVTARAVGDYVIPDSTRIMIRDLIGIPTIILGGSGDAVRAICVPQVNEVVSLETVVLSGTGEIQVNDLAAVPACQEP